MTDTEGGARCPILVGGNRDRGIPERHDSVSDVFVDGALFGETGLAAGIKQQVNRA